MQQDRLAEKKGSPVVSGNCNAFSVVFKHVSLRDKIIIWRRSSAALALIAKSLGTSSTGSGWQTWKHHCRLFRYWYGLIYWRLRNNIEHMSL